MSNILFITIDVPGNTFGSNKRSFHCIKALCDGGHHVDVIYFDRRNDNVQVNSPQCFNAVFHRVNGVIKPIGNMSKMSYRLKKMKYLLHILPFDQSSSDWNSLMGDKIIEICREKLFDLVVIDYEIASCLVSRIPRGIPCLLNTHSVKSDVVAREFKLGIHEMGYGPWIVDALCQVAKWKLSEYNSIRRFNKIICVCERDRHMLGDGKKLLVVRNGVDSGVYFSSDNNKGGKKIVFVGKMSYTPNEDAVLWFLKDIWPYIYLENEDAVLYIVGSDPSERVAELVKSVDGNIIVTGHVDSTIPYFDFASVIIVPIRLGGGTRLKVLEAAAMGRPIVSTTIGAEGIDELKDGESVIIRDIPRDFAIAVNEILGNPDKGDLLGKNAKRCMLDNYEWLQIERDFLLNVNNLLS